MHLEQMEMSLLPKCRARGCRLDGSDAVAPSIAWIADLVEDRLVLVVEAGVVRSIICVVAIGSVLTRFCWLVVALVAIGFIVVNFTHTKHTEDEQSESSMLFWKRTTVFYGPLYPSYYSTPPYLLCTSHSTNYILNYYLEPMI